MIPNQQILSAIWARSQGSVYFIGRYDRVGDTFAQLAYHTTPGELWPHAQNHGEDLYFTPLTFTQLGRANQYAGNPGILFADLDDGRANDKLPPTLLWETSPGMQQAVWFLDNPQTDRNLWRTLNRDLTRWTGADPGGWPESKFLRVPESVNWKRREFGKILAWDPTISYGFSEVRSVVPRWETESAEGPVFVGTEHPDPPDMKDREWIWRTYWPKLSGLAKSMVTKTYARDRSLYIVQAAHELLACGLTPESVFRLLWVADYNKWRTDRDRPEMLWQEIQKIDALR